MKVVPNGCLNIIALADRALQAHFFN